MKTYPSQKAIAIKLVYGPKWKLGDSPQRINLGSVLFPTNEGVEFADAMIRREFPEANATRLYNEHGHLFCSGSI
jgi:hypothetical protein